MLPSTASIKFVFNIITWYIAKTLGWSILEGVGIYFLWNLTFVGLIDGVHVASIQQSIGLVLFVKIISGIWIRDKMSESLIEILIAISSLKSLIYLALTPPVTKSVEDDITND